MFYFFYLLNALGYVCGGPLPNQVLLSRWFDAARGKAMGVAYLGIGIGGAIVPHPVRGARQRVRVARRPAAARRADHRLDAAVGLRRCANHQTPRRALGPTRRGADRTDRHAAAQSHVLPARRGQHVLDRRGRRHQPALEALPQPRPRLRAGRSGAHHFAGAHAEHRRPPAHGLARRSHAEEAGDADHLPAGRRVDSAAVSGRRSPARCTPSPSSSGSASAAST